MSLQLFYCLIPLLLSLSQRVHGFGMRLIDVSETERSQIVCTLALLQKYFQYGEPLSGSIISMSFTTASLHIQQDLLNALHTQVAIPLTVVVRNPWQAPNNVKSTMILHEKPQCYFIVIENLEDGDLEDIFEEWKTNINWNPLAQFVVYLASVEETDDEMTELMIEILLSFMNKKIYNVNVIGRNEENSFYYGKTVFPYHPDNSCGNRVIAIETLDMCEYQDENKPKYEYNFDEEDAGEEVDYDDEDDNGEQVNYDESDDDKTGKNDKVDREVYGEGNDYENRVEDKEGDRNRVQNKDGKKNDYEDKDKGGNKGKDTDTEDSKFGNGNNDGEESVNTDQTTESAEMDEKNDEQDGEVEEKTKNLKENDSVNEKSKEDIAEKDKEYNAIVRVFAGGKYKDQKQEGVDLIKNRLKIEKTVNGNKRADYEDIREPLENVYNIVNNYERRFNNKVEYIMVKETIEEERKTKDFNKYEIVHSVFLEESKNTKRIQEPKEIMRIGSGKKLWTRMWLEYVNDYIKNDRIYLTESEKGNNIGWSFKDFANGRQSDLKAVTGAQLKTNPNPKKRSKEKRNAKENKILQRSRTLRQKRQLAKRAKRAKLVDCNQDDTNDVQAPKVYIQELYRASFFEKFPKDLSGCPVVAAFRPWEPYIFKEANVYESKVDNNYRADNSNAVLGSYDRENGKTFEESNNNTYDDTDDGAEADNSYNDVYTVDLNDEPVMKLNGIEYQLVQTIAERLHITIDLQLENSNLYHLFQQLIDGDIEMILGGIDEDPSISQFVSSSIAYHQDDLTWCVARAKRKYDLFNFLQSFHISTWLCTLTFILITSLNICLAQEMLHVRLTYFDGFFATFVRILGIILSQSTQLTRLPNSLYITFGSTFFLAIMFVNVYQSFLVSTLTTPKSSYQISHLEEIYRNRMTVTGSVENVRHLNKDGEIFKYIREKFQMCYNIEECLNRAATDESLAVAVSRQHSFYNPHIKRDQLYCFDRNENLYVYLVTMLVPKKFHLLHKINPVIQHIIESGHMRKWARELDLKRRIREEIQRAQKVLVKSLTIKQVGGSFALHGMLSILATIIFLLECWTHWMVVKRRTRLRFAKWLHRKFGSKRESKMKVSA